MNVTDDLIPTTTNNWTLSRNGSALNEAQSAPPQTVHLALEAGQEEYYEKVGTYMQEYVLPPIYIIGILGNSLSAVLVARGSFRRMSSGVYMALLSLADLGACVMRAIEWVDTFYFSSYLGTIGLLCKVTMYLLNIFYVTSSWMVVAITAERAIIITLPHRTKAILTRRRAWWVSAAVLLVVGALNVYDLVIFGVEKGDTCFLMEAYNKKLTGIIFAIIDIMQYALVPLVILLVCNVILVRNLSDSLRFHQASGVSEAADAGTRRLIPLVVTVSVVFMVLTLPHSLFILSDFIPQDILWEATSKELWFEIVNIFKILNHAINFFLYFLTGPKFRQDFWNLFKLRKA